MKTKILTFIGHVRLQTISQIIQNFKLILTERKPENKRFKIAEIKLKSKTRKTIIFDTKLEMSSCQKVE